MSSSDSDEEGLEDVEFDLDDDQDLDEGGQGVQLDDGAQEVDEDSPSDDDDDGSDDDEDGSDEEEEDQDDYSEAALDLEQRMLSAEPPHESSSAASSTMRGMSQMSVGSAPSPPPAPPQVTRTRSLSPAQIRRTNLVYKRDVGLPIPRSFAVEAICALPHPVPTHSLASSLCMSHLLTGSDDGYIRDYDIFSAVNSKNFLTAPQRHHSGVVEGIMKSGQLRFWWENPGLSPSTMGLVEANAMEDETPLAPVYSLIMHSDALWALAGSDTGHINLFTVRHDPGRLCHVMNGHRGPVSALSMEHDEKGFYSAGWDGEAILWDLNTGQAIRNFTAHGAQLAAIAVRPIYTGYVDSSPPIIHRPMDVDLPVTQGTAAASQSSTQPNALSAANLSKVNQNQDVKPNMGSDTPSDVSFDPLFDDEPEESMTLLKSELEPGMMKPEPDTHQLAMPTNTAPQPPPLPPPVRSAPIPPPKGAPPLLDPEVYATYSPDVFMTASIDGQVILWDKRANPGRGVGRLWMNEKTPPWCLSACWSADGAQVYAGRRNGTVDVWDVRQFGLSGPSSTPRLLKTLRNPLSSGVVSCVVAFPDGRHIACASIDNLRLWNVAEAAEPEVTGRSRSGVQFKIIPGHHGGYISQMLVDPGAKFLVCASSNRGWHGESTRTVFVHDIKPVF